MTNHEAGPRSRILAPISIGLLVLALVLYVGLIAAPARTGAVVGTPTWRVVVVWLPMLFAAAVEVGRRLGRWRGSQNRRRAGD